MYTETKDFFFLNARYFEHFFFIFVLLPPYTPSQLHHVRNGGKTKKKCRKKYCETVRARFVQQQQQNRKNFPFENLVEQKQKPTTNSNGT